MGHLIWHIRFRKYKSTVYNTIYIFILNHTKVSAIVTIKERESMFAEMLKHTGVAKGASSGSEFYP